MPRDMYDKDMKKKKKLMRKGGGIKPVAPKVDARLQKETDAKKAKIASGRRKMARKEAVGGVAAGMMASAPAIGVMSAMGRKMERRKKYPPKPFNPARFRKEKAAEKSMRRQGSLYRGKMLDEQEKERFSRGSNDASPIFDTKENRRDWGRYSRDTAKRQFKKEMDSAGKSLKASAERNRLNQARKWLKNYNLTIKQYNALPRDKKSRILRDSYERGILSPSVRRKYEAEKRRKKALKPRKNEPGTKWRVKRRRSGMTY